MRQRRFQGEHETASGEKEEVQEGMDKEIPIATLSKGLALSKLITRFSSSSCSLVFCQSEVLRLAGQGMTERAEITCQLNTPWRISLAK